MSKAVLLVIDPQVDFCSPDGNLSVPGADKDMDKLATMVKRASKKIDDIVVTLDSHHLVHIAHPIWWVDDDGNQPDPFTLISKDDVCGSNPKWKARNPGFQKRSEEYVTTLDANDRYKLCIWPPHCLIGSEGHAVMPVLFDALCEWESQFRSVNYVTKGSNIFTEHYSALMADVVDPEDNGTSINTKLLEAVEDADIIGISGEASSHCVANTVTDIADNFGEENIKKLVFLNDTSSPVPSFESFADDFIKDMTDRGMKIMDSSDFLA